VLGELAARTDELIDVAVIWKVGCYKLKGRSCACAIRCVRSLDSRTWSMTGLIARLQSSAIETGSAEGRDSAWQ
jgi:hypothetical protein